MVGAAPETKILGIEREVVRFRITLRIEYNIVLLNLEFGLPYTQSCIYELHEICCIYRKKEIIRFYTKKNKTATFLVNGFMIDPNQRGQT